MSKMFGNYRKEMEEKFKAEVKKFFLDNPEVELITWRQYVPSWNDGEPCYFSIAEPAVKFVDDEDFDDSNCQGNYCDFPKEKLELVKDLIDAINEEEWLMQALFGDNARVTLTKDGMTSEDYDCGW